MISKLIEIKKKLLFLPSLILWGFIVSEMNCTSWSTEFKRFLNERVTEK